MIKMLRVDDRLIHGQVAMTWTSFLGADTLVVACDKHAKDQFLGMALNLGKPPGTVLHILTVADAITYLNNPENNSQKLFVIVPDTSVALEICKNVAEVKDVTLGGIRQSGDKKRVERQVFLDQQDFDNCDAMTALGKSVTVRVIPSEKQYTMSEAKKTFDKAK